MNTQSNGSEVVKGFFAAFAKGNVDGVLAAFHPRVEIIAVRRGPRAEGGLYGTYSGSEGVEDFVQALGATFDTRAFAVDQVVSEGNIVFASGSFTHEVKSTKKPFRSDWALKCIVEDGKIREYHFYEDSAAYVEAARP